MAVKVGIAVFPGSNCDRDVHHILNNIIGVETDLIWHNKYQIHGYDSIIIPGGFAFGDRLRPGIIAAHSPIMQEVKRMAKEGLPVLGICNGFQILVEAELLPGALLMNDSLRFVCRWTNVQVTNNNTPFTSQFASNTIFRIPVAHGDGRYVADRNMLKELKKKNQIVLQYANDDPNGSTDLIAAVCNEDGNVVGMMPHPERATENILRLDHKENNKKMSTTSNNCEAITIFKSLISNLHQKAIA